jgi:hypothetical protein
MHLQRARCTRARPPVAAVPVPRFRSGRATLRCSPLTMYPCSTSQAEREAREEKEKKRAENREKGMSYQVITNMKKIKKMSKKQLRQIKKADTSGVAPKQYGSAATK